MVTQVWLTEPHPSPSEAPSTIHTQQQGTQVTKQDILNAIRFLERVYVGQADQDRLFKTIEALKLELDRRNKK